jgi:hypothetical protein
MLFEEPDPDQRIDKKKLLRYIFIQYLLFAKNQAPKLLLFSEASVFVMK